jgi:hypothetical protein
LKQREPRNKKPIDAKLLSLLAAESFVVMLVFAVGVYGAGSMFVGKIVYFSYFALGLALLAVAIFLNGGLDSYQPTEEDIVGNLTKEQRSEIANKIRRRKAIAKKILFFDFPFLCCLLFDTVYVLLL